jgi:hypothetical protein
MQELTENVDGTPGISSPDAAMNNGMLPRAALEVHRKALVVAAASSGLESVWLEYAGSGDSGNTSEIGFDPETANVAGLIVDTLSFTVTWDRVDGPRYTGTPARRPAEEVLEEMTDLAITACGHTNYEDNEGGYGTLALDFGSGALSWTTTTTSKRPRTRSTNSVPETLVLHRTGMRRGWRAAVQVVADDWPPIPLIAMKESDGSR